MKNKYLIWSHISERKFKEILRLFSLDIEAKQTAEITQISRQTINKLFDNIREVISNDCSNASPFESGEIELDKSYF